MTIYFTASIIGKKYFLSNYLQIIGILKKKKYEIISDHIINSSESQIREEKKEERLKFQNKLEKWIRSCDYMIVETSYPSTSVGFEISLALHYGKPVLILFSEGKPPSLLAHHKNENLVCEKYNEKNLPQIIDKWIRYVERINDTKFTFFIPPEMDSYLDSISIKEKVPKSVFLRQLIEEDKKKEEKIITKPQFN